MNTQHTLGREAQFGFPNPLEEGLHGPRKNLSRDTRNGACRYFWERTHAPPFRAEGFFLFCLGERTGTIFEGGLFLALVLDAGSLTSKKNKLALFSKLNPGTEKKIQGLGKGELARGMHP